LKLIVYKIYSEDHVEEMNKNILNGFFIFEGKFSVSHSKSESMVAEKFL